MSDPTAVVRAIEEFDTIGREAFLERYGFGTATRFFVERDGRHYDSKAVVGAAHGFEFPERGPLAGEWFPGLHEPIITADEFAAAHRGRVKGRRRGRDLLSGRVRCGLCDRLMTIDSNGEGRVMYGCRHRDQGCDQPRRSAKGLLRAALLGIRLLARDEALQEADPPGAEEGPADGPTGPEPAGSAWVDGLERLIEQRQKLLNLHYEDRLSAELFDEEEERLTRQIAAYRQEASDAQAADEQLDDLARRFEQVVLRQLDVDRVCAEATASERRVLIDELVDSVAVHPDHLEVAVHGAPRLNVTLQEVGLARPWQIGGVGGAFQPLRTRIELG